MKFVFSCPSSHPALRWTAAGLVARGHDVSFFNPLAFTSDQFALSVQRPMRLGLELRKRALPVNLKRDSIYNASPMREMLRVGAERMQLAQLNYWMQERVNIAVQKNAISHMEYAGRPDAIIATGSLSGIISEYAYENSIPQVLYLPQPLTRFLNNLVPGQGEYLDSRERVKAGEIMASSAFLASSRLVEDSIRFEGIDKPIIRQSLGFPPIGKVESGRQVEDCKSANDTFRLMYVGRVSPQKGIEYLLAAIREIKDKQRVHLTAITRDHFEMIKLVNEYNLTEWVEVRPAMERSELFSLMGFHHCFVLPSAFEGYGLVIVEALSRGLPVISTKYTAAGDLMIDGRAGLVVPASDSIHLASAILNMARNPSVLSQYSRNAVHLADGLNWETYAEIVSNKIEEVVSSM